ncbi:hypothetical protein Tco_0526060, partial [Tanacetum coccineum]
EENMHINFLEDQPNVTGTGPNWMFDLDGIFISQDKYVVDILKKFDFWSIKTATTPIESNKPLVKDKDGVDVDVHVYRSMIGSLMYLTASRLDIMSTVCACVRFQVTPKASHLNEVKRIFRYLKHQPKLGLWYPRDSPFEFETYSDSDYGGASLDKKSTTGGCQFLGRRLISWKCKKQTIVANSTTEAEYVAVVNCFKQFWQTAIVRTLANGTQQLVASIDFKEYTITEHLHMGGDFVPLMPAMLAGATMDQGEGSAQPFEPHHTPVDPITIHIPTPPFPSPPLQSPPHSPL